jgi:hypothetical protein
VPWHPRLRKGALVWSSINLLFDERRSGVPLTTDESQRFRRTNLPFHLEGVLLEVDASQSHVTLAIEPEGALRLVAVSPWGVDSNRVGEGVGELIVDKWRILGGRLPSGASFVELRAGDGGSTPALRNDSLFWLTAVPAQEAVEIVFTGSGSQVVSAARFDPWEEPRVHSSLASRMLVKLRTRARMKLPRSSIGYGP